MSGAWDFQKEPWRHPVAWKSHLVTMKRELICNVVSQVGTCECGWSIACRIADGVQPVSDAAHDHWRAVIAEAEASAA
jgi:hypothetical protein